MLAKNYSEARNNLMENIHIRNSKRNYDRILESVDQIREGKLNCMYERRWEG